MGWRSVLRYLSNLTITSKISRVWANRDYPFSYLTPVKKGLVAWKHLLIAFSYKNPVCERSFPYKQCSSIHSCSAAWSGTCFMQGTYINCTWGGSGAPDNDHSLSPIPVLIGQRGKAQVNSGAPAPLHCRRGGKQGSEFRVSACRWVMQQPDPARRLKASGGMAGVSACREPAGLLPGCQGMQVTKWDLILTFICI